MTRVLIIDDDALLSRLTSAALERFGGMEVVAASSGVEGLRLARTERPDCILLDVEMPGMDGVETFAALRGDAEIRAVPVIFLTARRSEEEVRELETLGPLGVLTKPFDVTRLADRVRDLLGRG